MRKSIAVALFVLVVLIIFLITIDVFPNLRDWIYQNHINDKIAHLFFACVLTFLANFIFYPKKLQAFSLHIWLGSTVMFFFYSKSKKPSGSSHSCLVCPESDDRNLGPLPLQKQTWLNGGMTNEADRHPWSISSS